ncbi:DUF4435 domain-containing protein [Pseudomonas sp. UBA2684]|uniref:DUF4435 domain-containing protein n=1 Tax=Pseudomonas sp. UBA2684 TaxID=1947311 RepID=UPI0025EABB32|nr:DUF4435 domain-containing protein [Pseudomonas sp. UBA2684]
MNQWNKSVGDLIAEIKMMQTDFKGFFWLVEGPSDIRFFECRRYKGVALVAAGGKANVIETVAALRQDPVNSKLIGVVDADVDWLKPIENRPPNILSTDPRDLEGLLLRSRALDKLLSEYATPQKIDTFEAKIGNTVREYIRSISEKFGKIRAANLLHNDVSLKCLKPQNFIISNRWAYDLERVYEFCVSRGVASTAEELKTLVAGLPSTDPWNYVRGHDAVGILTGGLMTELGRGGRIDNSRVESALRIGMEDEEYKLSSISQQLSNWHPTDTGVNY